MKKIFLLSTALLIVLLTKAQEIGRLSLNITETKKDAEAEKKVQLQNIAAYNALVKKWNAEKLLANFNTVRNFLIEKAPVDTGLKKLLDKVDKTDLSKPLDTIVIAEKVSPVQEAEQPAAQNAEQVCEGIATLKELKIEKNIDAEYVCMLLDNADNPVRSFKLTQFNEQLFNDKFKNAIFSICNGKALSNADSGKINTFYESVLKQQNLYQRMLEASLEVKDDNVLAGILRVNKEVPVTIEITKYDTTTDKGGKKAGKQKKDSSNKTGMQLYDPGNGDNGYASNKRFSTGFINALYNDVDNIPVNYNTRPAGQGLQKDPDTSKVTVKYGIFIVHSIQIQFQDGFIENLKVIGHLKGSSQELKFENAYPISFSTRKDYRNLQNIKIYERTAYAKKKDADSSCRFILGDLLFYNQNLQLNTKDYSPVNKVLDEKITAAHTEFNLYKELTSKILEMKVFSDLKGLGDGEPNGLVQLELCKKINFLTFRWPVPVKRAKVNIGLFNYFTPSFAMNKIENNSKRLTPQFMGTRYPDTSRPNIFASTLDLFQRQVFTVGGNLTVFTIDIPGLKSTINIGAGVYWGRVLVEDTMRAKIDSSNFAAIKDNNINQFGGNTVQFTPEVSWQVFPDKRYGVIFTQRFTHYNLQSTVLRQVKDSTQYDGFLRSLKGDRTHIEDYRFQKWLGNSEIYAFFMPTEYNKVFFRYRFNWDLGGIKNNFHQLQLGIATYLTHTKKKDQQKDK